MQKSIRDAIEKNCGVTVRDVQIVVSALSGPDAKPEWKKPRWKAGRRGKKESVEAIAAQEAAEPVPEVPAERGRRTWTTPPPAEAAGSCPQEDEAPERGRRGRAELRAAGGRLEAFPLDEDEPRPETTMPRR